jgi:hypothetical protein
MKRMCMSALRLIAATVVAVTMAGSAEAVSVNLTGSVNFVAEPGNEFGTTPNPFGITTSSAVSGIATWNGTPDEFGVLSIIDDPTMTLALSIAGDTGVFAFDSATDGFSDLTYGFAVGGLQAISLLLGTGTDAWGLDIAYDLVGVNVFSLVAPTDFLPSVTGVIAVAQAAVPEPAVAMLIAAAALGLLVPALRRHP